MIQGRVMEDNEAGFKAKVAKFIEVMGITDADVRKDTGEECSTVAEYIEKLANDYYKQVQGAS